MDKLVRLGLVERVQRDVLNPGQLVLHVFRDVTLLEVNREDDLLAFAGEGQFLDDILGAGGVLADGKDEQVAFVNGLDDFLGPHGGAVDVGFIHPDAQPLFAKILHQPNHLLLVLTRVTYKNVRVQCGLFAFF